MDVKKKIAELQKMTVSELRKEHIELFNEPTKSGNRPWLFRRLAWRVQSLAEGDLSERAKERAKQLVREADMRIRPPQELKMPPANGDRSRPVKFNFHDERLPMPGAVLTRKFKGQLYHVNVLTKGFEFDGELYRSLSAIAHKITGCHWNGYHFFGFNKGNTQ